MVKVGDRVRSLVTEFDVREGGIYKVETVGSDGAWVIDDFGDDYYLCGDQYEPVAVADSNGNQHGNRFKVGDRVEAQSSAFGATKGKIYTVAGYARPTDIGEWISLMELVSYSSDGSFPEKSFKPAPLTVRAGKFYRTRDGRKVGPAEISCDYEYPWRASGALYMDNGRWLNDDIEDDNDIIAEWTDADEVADCNNDYAPTPTTGFTVPLDAPEFGGAESKFKVGDRVNTDGGFTFDPGVGTITEVDDNLYVVTVDDHGGGWNYYESELRLVAKATTAQEPSALMEFRDGKFYLRADRFEIHSGNDNEPPTSIADIVRRLERLESAAEPEWIRHAKSGERDLAAAALFRLTGMRHSDARYVVDRYAA